MYHTVKSNPAPSRTDQATVCVRRRPTAAATVSIAKSISSIVVNRPRPNRRLARAMSSSRPIAKSTWLGSGSADEQAEPELTAMSRIAIMSASPSMSPKLRFKLPGKRRSADR